MSTSKYHTLREALQRNLDAWAKYERDCTDFANLFRTEFAEYLGCSPNRIERIPFDANAGALPESAAKMGLGNFTFLDWGAFWHYAYKIDFDGRFIKLELSIKRVDDNFITKYGVREIEVADDDLSYLLEHCFTSVLDFLETEFDNFISGKPRRELGFSVSLTTPDNNLLI